MTDPADRILRAEAHADLPGITFPDNTPLEDALSLSTSTTERTETTTQGTDFK